MTRVLDFSAALPRATEIKRADYDGVLLYCSPPREPWMKAKQPPRGYLDTLDREQVKFGFVWQYGGANAPDTMRGYNGGVADARAAQRYLDSVACSGHPVYFAVDFNITLAQWNTTAVEYFRGAISVLGRHRVGIYGHSRAVAWAKQDNVVATVAPGRVLGWVTSSWNAVGYEPYSTVYQGTHNVPGPDGVQVDVNTVLHDEWGWRAIPSLPAPSKALADVVPTPPVVNWTHKFTFGRPRPLADVVYIFIHVTVNTPGTPAENVANYQIRSQSGSYNSLGDMKKVLRTNTLDWVVWATGNKGNIIGAHFSYVATGRETRAQWLGELKPMFLNGAWEVANWCCELNIPAVVVDSHGLLTGVPGTGLSTHKATRVWGGTDHVDPGEGFPMDVLADTVNQYLGLMEATTTEEGDSIMSALSPDEQRQLFDAVIETRNFARDLHKHITQPTKSLVDGSEYRGNMLDYVKLTDRKVEELHVEYHGKASKAQVDADDLQERNDAGESMDPQHGGEDK